MSKVKFMVNTKLFVTSSFLLFLSFSTIAAEVKTFGDLDQLQGERIWYEQLAATNKAKREATDLGGISYSASNVVSGVNAQPIQQQLEIPKVAKIFGSVNSLKVKLSYPNGNESISKTGDILPGGYKITSITINGVTAVQVESGKKITIN